MQSAGIREFLLQRSRGMRFWIASALTLAGVLSFVMMCAATILAFRAGIDTRRSMQSISAMLVGAAAVLLIGNVLLAPIQARREFVRAAHVAVMYAITSALFIVAASYYINIAFAVASGLGLAAILRLFIIGRLNRVNASIISGNVSWRLIRLMVVKNAMLIAAVLLASVSQNVVNYVAFERYPKSSAAAIAFNLSLSNQAVQLVGMWAGQVYFPTICAEKPDAGEVRHAARSTARGLCFLMVMLGLFKGEIVHIVFGSKWLYALPNLGAYLTAAYFIGASLLVGPLLQARGKWNALLVCTAIGTAISVSFVVFMTGNDLTLFGFIWLIASGLAGGISLAFVADLRNLSFIAEYMALGCLTFASAYVR